MTFIGLLMPVLVFYILTIAILLYYKQRIPKNGIKEMELKKRSADLKMKTIHFVLAYVKMALQKIGISNSL